MEINLNKQDLDKLKKLFQVRDNNYFVSNIINQYDQDFFKQFNEKVLLKKQSLTDSQKIAHEIFEKLGIDAIKNKDLIEGYFQNNIKRLSQNKYVNNPYYNNINPQKCKNKKIELKKIKYSPYEFFLLKDNQSIKEEDYKEVTEFGFFENEFSYLAIIENNVTWMSTCPHEIETMEKAITVVQGNVITFGLGLGYFPYMVSLKDDVQSVTIIEKNQIIIDIFNELLLPQFENKEKIKIIKEDAFVFLREKMKNQKYDYAFFDLWHDGSDGLEMYLKIKSYEDVHESIQFLYWIENSFLLLLRRCLINLLEEQIHGSKETDYLKETSFSDKIINKMYFLLKNKVINEYKEIERLLDDSSLLFLSKEILKDKV